MFRGSVPVRISSRGTLRLPADFRRVIEERYGPQLFVLARASGGLLIYPQTVWDQLSPAQLAITDEAGVPLLSARELATGTALAMDVQGRLWLPKRVRAATALSGDAIVSAHLDHLVVWDHDVFASRLAQVPFAEEINRGRLDHLYEAGKRSGIEVDEVHFWQQLIAELAVNPSLVHGLSPRRFEELVARLLERDGLSVTLTPQSADGGRDVIAALNLPMLPPQLYFIECKRYRSDRPVGIALVRSLYGVVASRDVTAGILVTTSRFTRPSKSFEEKHQYKIALRDYNSLVEWLRSSGRLRPAPIPPVTST